MITPLNSKPAPDHEPPPSVAVVCRLFVRARLLLHRKSKRREGKGKKREGNCQKGLGGEGREGEVYRTWSKLPNRRCRVEALHSKDVRKVEPHSLHLDGGRRQKRFRRSTTETRH
eukprot:2188769-Rhodomonas_salina.3